LKIFTLIKRAPLEAVIWTAGLIALACYHPETEVHVSLCPLANLGFDFCPGCGLGRSISHLFRGQFMASFQAHPLGIFAVIILVYRIVKLSLTHYQHYGKNT
jgi:hypothetical protein